MDLSLKKLMYKKIIHLIFLRYEKCYTVTIWSISYENMCFYITVTHQNNFSTLIYVVQVSNNVLSQFNVIKVEMT